MLENHDQLNIPILALLLAKGGSWMYPVRLSVDVSEYIWQTVDGANAIATHVVSCLS